MRAGVLHGIDDLRFSSVPEPKLGAGDMLLKVKAATVCGTDIRILHGKKTAGIRFPSIIGHEFVGIVVEAGSNTQFHMGQSVAVCPSFSCGECDLCAMGAENLCRNLVAMGYEIDGAFAEYVRVPASGVQRGNVMPLGENATHMHFALAEPLACVINGQEQARLGNGDAVVIFGAGPIGLLHIKLARFSGASKIIVSQRSAARRDAALRAGADVVLDPEAANVTSAVLNETGGRGADVAICAIGVPSLVQEALASVRPRGRVNLFAGFPSGMQAPCDVNAIHYKEIQMSGAFGLTRAHYRRAVDLIATGAIEVGSLVSHRFPLSEINPAFAMAESKHALKVALIPG